MKFTKESVLKTFNSLTMPAWVKRVITLIIDYVDEAAPSIDSKADLIGGKVPAEQLPSYVDDVIEFESIINGSDPINFYLNNQSYTDKVYYIQGSTSIEGTLSFKYNKKFINFGTNTSEDDWIIIEPEQGKIYINVGSGNDSNHSFRWSGSDLIDLDKNWSDKINNLEAKTLTVYLGDIQNPLDLSTLPNISILSTVYIYLNQRARYLLINLRWRYNSTHYSSPIIDVDPIERTFAIYNQGYLQTYKVLKEDNNYSLVKVKEFPNFVYLDYSTLGTALDDNTINQIQKASVVLINDDAAKPYNKSVYLTKSKTNTYLQFVMVGSIDNSEQMITYKELSVNTSTKVWTIVTKKYTLPYGAYSQFGFTGKSSSTVNQEVARLVNMNSYNITSSDLNKVHSGDKLENIKNATFLILDEGSGKTKIFIRGLTNESIIYYINGNTIESLEYLLLKTDVNILGKSTAIFDDVVYNSYKNNGGTKTSKALMYKELAAQLTENTFVIDASKLGTTLTNEEAATVQEATTLIVTNIPNIGTLVFNKGNANNVEIHFNTVFMAYMGSVYIRRILYNKNTKILSVMQAQISNPFQWYIANNGIINNQLDFTALNNFLFDNTFIIDKTLLNTTITDTDIQNGIKRANILVVKDSTDNSYVVFIKGFIASNAIYFFNLNNANSDNITADRIFFNTTNNLLNSSQVYLQSAFNAYKLGGGTKYTTESAFNAQFTKVIDMTVTQ